MNDGCNIFPCFSAHNSSIRSVNMFNTSLILCTKSPCKPPVLYAHNEQEYTPIELYLWNISKGEGGRFICGTTCAGDGGL